MTEQKKRHRGKEIKKHKGESEMEKRFELNDKELEKVAGGPEERTVLGLKSATDCRMCECGQIIEDDGLSSCPFCGKMIGAKTNI